MRQLISLCVLGLLCLPWARPAPAAGEGACEEAEHRVDDRLTTPDWVDFSILPEDVEGLRGLDFDHRSIARRAARTCFEGRTGVPGGKLFTNPCVLRRVAEGLNVEGDEQLKAFHYALPLRVRYDGMRTDVDWLQPVQEVVAGEEPPQQ